MASALTGKLEGDVEIKASAEKFHDMFCNKPHHVSNTCSEKVQGCELHDDGEAKKAKQVIEAIDSEKNSITFRMIEGDLMKEYKSFVIKFQATPKSEGEGSIVHWTFEYEKLHEGIAHPETLLEFLLSVSKDISAHLTQGN
ncbi:Bet v I/Major latex protein - like 10 [Theobroma cacao]|nr:Bet v I/Major latex protein - like 10 [Theobroma cacao]